MYLGQHCHPKLFQPVPFARDVELQACTTLPSDRKRIAEDGGFEEDVKDLEKKRTLVSLVPPVTIIMCADTWLES